MIRTMQTNDENQKTNHDYGSSFTDPPTKTAKKGSSYVAS